MDGYEFVSSLAVHETPKPAVAGRHDASPPSQGDETASSPLGRTASIGQKQRDERLRASGLIIEEWANLEDSIRQLGRAHGYSDARYGSFTLMLDRFLSHQVLSEETAKLFIDLRDLRNRVAHSQMEPTKQAGEDYAASCSAACQAIRADSGLVGRGGCAARIHFGNPLGAALRNFCIGS